jgi:hypothetical protein
MRRWNRATEEAGMDVLGLGMGMKFEEVPKGGLFLTNKNDKPKVGIKCTGDFCVLLFPEKADYQGPG